MKKTYINPETKVITIETMHMIAESMAVISSGKSFDNSLSRDGGDWDDED